MTQEQKEYLDKINTRYDYGIITYKHRFSINRSLNDYEETTLTKVIRMGLELVYKTMAKDKLIYEYQICYKDNDNKLQCICLDLHDWYIEIKHKGDCMITI